MADKIPNPVSYDASKDAFCCRLRRFGLGYQKRFTTVEDALLFVRENAAFCPELQPHLLQLNDYHYGHWERQLERVQRHPRRLTPSPVLWLVHALAVSLCVPLALEFSAAQMWQPPEWLLALVHAVSEQVSQWLSLSWYWQVEIRVPLFWLLLVPLMLLALALSRALVLRIHLADLRLELRLLLLWLLPLLYGLVYLLAYGVGVLLLHS
uniref:hypothetical protein n=1 Tax=Marinobacterium profundum TaxID=1714300 RepID=UPI000831F133|nr:hypothetical protein [Marinobacterium profundum]